MGHFFLTWLGGASASGWSRNHQRHPEKKVIFFKKKILASLDCFGVVPYERLLDIAHLLTLRIFFKKNLYVIFFLLLKDYSMILNKLAQKVSKRQKNENVSPQKRRKISTKCKQDGFLRRKSGRKNYLSGWVVLTIPGL